MPWSARPGSHDLPRGGKRLGRESFLIVHACRVVSDSATLWTAACQAPLSVGFPRQEHWSGLLFSALGDLLDPGIKPVSPALAGRFLTTEPPGKTFLIM